ncbi:hypothetical protein BUALT_Bualt03G0164700 [Buddleja alternifolia]|uniref:NAC domain-containing protein n=1 Tax=Buddleja alternifolia TaxID=168488 RepID=A0AAV6Y151_9LAMI|nr:hypothetical protein BUALT_Bualt03G0164700 [Buddleja alternifolia]
MSSLSTVEAKLPPGFRFHPKDDELICDYLMKWITGCPNQFPLLIEVDLNKCEPWDIPVIACVGGKEWYFYSQRDRKYATGLRTNRATLSGYWKATGKDRPIIRKGTLIGMRKTLVFYQGRAPKGTKTEWVMHEFRLEGTLGPSPKIISSVKEDWVLCRVFYKNRSEVPAGKQEIASRGNINAITAAASSNSPSLPPLMEPAYNNNNITTIYDQTHHQYHDEQVPCFSIFTSNQTNPNFTPHQETLILPPTKTIPINCGGLLFPDHHLGINYMNSISPPLDYNDPSSNCNKKVIKAVLNHLTKMESSSNISMDGSPSFGEGSSDSTYLSEVGLSSIWNHQYS